MFPPRFPPEIIDHVLSFLQRDRVTLKICAEAHPSLSKLAERHLCAHLTVQNVNNWDSDVKRIVDNPNNGRHVRSLRIILSVYRADWKLGSILRAVTQLQAIFLDSATGRMPIGWHDLSESFRTAFTNCLRLPTLTDVNISDIDAFPLSALDHSGSLKRLFLSGDFGLPSISSDLVYPPLDSLVLYHCSTSIRPLTSWVKSRGFRSLEFNSDLRSISRLLGVSADILTTLNVHVPPDYSTRYSSPSNNSTIFTPIPFSLARLPHLARLTIQSSIFFSQLGHTLDLVGHTQDSCLPAIMHLLNTLPSPPTDLALLVIGIKIYTDDTSGDISDTEWSPLISFPYFNVIPSIELRVRAQKWATQIPSVALLNTLKENPHLMQLERHHSFLIKAVE